MHLTTRNVNSGFRDLVGIFASGARFVTSRPSRNGNVLMIDEPVTITYTHPTERVLFNAARDANPFFHLYEALWMLAGRNDVASLTYYCSRMREFSDDGETLNGAYGRRWRRAERYEWSTPGDAYRSEVVDQLDLLVNHLKADPTSRRAVLQMWDVEDDLLKIGQPNPRGEIGAYRVGDRVVPSDSSRDVCCNLSVMFSLRREAEPVPQPMSNVPLGPMPEGVGRFRSLLDMTVTNRSNDLVWGLLGANYVHFTVLQEYVAARLGAEVGKYHHFSNNLHVYRDRKDWKPEEWLNNDGKTPFDRYNDGYLETTTEANVTWKTKQPFSPFPLVRDPEAFERELPLFVEANSRSELSPKYREAWTEPFLRGVAQPMCYAFHHHKAGDKAGAGFRAAEIKADDWRIACTEWLHRRAK